MFPVGTYQTPLKCIHIVLRDIIHPNDYKRVFMRTHTCGRFRSMYPDAFRPNISLYNVYTLQLQAVSNLLHHRLRLIYVNTDSILVSYAIATHSCTVHNNINTIRTIDNIVMFYRSASQLFLPKEPLREREHFAGPGVRKKKFQ